MEKIVCLLIAIFACLLPVDAVDGNNYILNTHKSAYNNGSQIWQISEYSNGWMYLANNKGLVQHNGSAWHSYSFGGAQHLPFRLGIEIKKVYLCGWNK